MRAARAAAVAGVVGVLRVVGLGEPADDEDLLAVGRHLGGLGEPVVGQPAGEPAGEVAVRLRCSIHFSHYIITCFARRQAPECRPGGGSAYSRHLVVVRRTSGGARRSRADRRPWCGARRARARAGTAWLTTLFSATHEPCAPSAVDHRGRAPLHRDEQRRSAAASAARAASRRARAGTTSTWPLKTGRMSRNATTSGSSSTTCAGALAGDDRAEQAIVAGHAARATARRPAAPWRSGTGTRPRCTRSARSRARRRCRR